MKKMWCLTCAYYCGISLQICINIGAFKSLKTFKKRLKD